jgi:phospholipid/cholesterol/gamma-HCH transport system permease protein
MPNEEGHVPHDFGAAPTTRPGAVHALGAAAIDLFVGGREMYSVFVRTLYYVVHGRRENRALARQMFEIGNRSVFFISITMGFIGMILVYQAGLQAKRIVPDFTMLGATYLELLVRDFAASIGALMLATRVGAGIAAEIGSMVVTEQVDALRMCAADPIDFLIVPRFLASLVMTTVLIVLAGTVAFGLSTFGGSEGVGWATTRAVVNSSLAIIILNAFISTAGLLVFGAK